MTAYYNDFDEGACAWLRELIKQGHIADGVVDNRSILEVEAHELKEFTQCHFFAGIGGWSYALRLAGWADDRPVWTGSPPCQPFSAAGKRDGRDDERHLAPHFLKLVRDARPPMLFGEQVASADVFGKVASKARGKTQEPPKWAWLDDLSDRLEAAHYATGATDISAAGVGAPNIRQRTFFGAYDLRLAASGLCDALGARLEGQPRHGNDTRGRSGAAGSVAAANISGKLADAAGRGCGKLGGKVVAGEIRHPDCGFDASSGLADPNGGNASAEREQRGGQQRLQPQSGGDGGGGDQGSRPQSNERVAQPRSLGRGGWKGTAQGSDNDRDDARRSQGDDGAVGPNDTCLEGQPTTRPTNGFWANADWLFCRDGRWRPVEASTFPLAHGVSSRMGLLRGYGNAINPHGASQFIQAFTEAMTEEF